MLDRHKPASTAVLTPEEKDQLIKAWTEGSITTDEMAAMRQDILDARQSAPKADV